MEQGCFSMLVNAREGDQAVNVGPPSFLPPSPPSPTKPTNRTYLCHDGLLNTQAQPSLLRFARLQLLSSLSFGRCQSELETMNPAREIWLLRLSSAFRTALACTIVG
ncbi:hypothetical protein L1049_009481 [Liquidambar formosana]|uniref:Uncharacterized protein n=1 Tax=Liquidambar formosana TaxID=63359 RepID=A0AAP0S5B6_LIQFO